MTLHERRCWKCHNVAMHEDSVTPYVLCKKCGSQDTRRMKSSEEESVPSGFLRATYGDKVTHAVCRHGVVCEIAADNHTCSWTPLVKIRS